MKFEAQSLFLGTEEVMNLSEIEQKQIVRDLLDEHDYELFSLLLMQNQWIKQLAQNSRLLQTLVVIYKYQGLPRDRCKAYDKIVENFVVFWEVNISTLRHLQAEDIRPLLSRLAYKMHVQGIESVKDDLTHFLATEIQALKNIERDSAEKEAISFSEIVKEHPGLIFHKSNYCAFINKVFQQYLCAEAIIYEWHNEDTFEVVQRHIDKYFSLPHWQEVFRFIICQSKPKQAIRIAQAIFVQNSSFEL